MGAAFIDCWWYIYQTRLYWAPLASFFTALMQGLRATKTAVSVGVVLYRKWRYQPSQWRHCFPLAMALDLLLSACIGCQLAFYLRPIITINYSPAEGKEVRQPCLPWFISGITLWKWIGLNFNPLFVWTHFAWTWYSLPGRTSAKVILYLVRGERESCKNCWRPPAKFPRKIASMAMLNAYTM